MKEEKKYLHNSRNHDRNRDREDRYIAARADKLCARPPPRLRAARIKSRTRRCFIVYAVAQSRLCQRVWYRRGGDSGGRRYRDKREKRGAFFGVDAPLFSSAWKGRAASPCTAPRVHAGWVSQSRPLPLRFSACIRARIHTHPANGTAGHPWNRVASAFRCPFTSSKPIDWFLLKISILLGFFDILRIFGNSSNKRARSLGFLDSSYKI